MKTYTPDKIRNVGLASHSGSGKTTLAEAMLYDSGCVTRRGTVEEGSTVMDYDPEEAKRQISIHTAIASFEWKGHKINLIDTPGDPNFINNAFSAISVMDSVVIPIPADTGIKALTEKVWARASARKIPKILFVNKMDSDRADYAHVIQRIHDVFQVKILRLTLPIGAGAAFKGVVDLLYMKSYIYQRDGEGRFVTGDIPPELRETAEQERKELVESVAVTDEKLLDMFMANGTLEEEVLFQGFRKAVIAGDLTAVVCGSALYNIVVRKTLDLIVNFMPSPLDLGPAMAVDDAGAPVAVAPDPNGHPAAHVFRTVADPFAGRLSVFRVYSGSFSADSAILNVTRGEKEHIGALLEMHGKKQTPISSAVTGDIVAVAKLKYSATGDTLCAAKEKFHFEKTSLPEPVMTFAIQPKSKGDEDKVSIALGKIMEEDLSLRSGVDPATREHVISGMGLPHIEMTVARLKEKYGVEVSIHPPKIAYKETIRGKATGHGRLKKQTGGHGQFADCHLELEPTADFRDFEFVNGVVGGVIPRQYIPGIEKGVKEAMAEGVLAHYPVTGCRVTVFDGKHHDVDSSEMAFKIAAREAFREAFMRANPALLEPMVKMEIEAPEECVGGVMGDLNHRRGRVLSVEAGVGSHKITALAPLAETLTYAPDLRSMTGGRGGFSMRVHGYEEAPPQVAGKIIEAGHRPQKQ
jgi:elongation factor G